MTKMTTGMKLPLITEKQMKCCRMGVLSVAKTGETASSPLPLAAVEITAKVAGRVAQVTLTQTFHNSHKEALEAVYTFPISGGAAVSEFELRSSRVIKGRVEERSEARRQYQQALDEGRRAGLLEQERDDVFTVQLGNLPPGETLTVKITYSDRLPFFDDGTTELRLPLVVAPRYIAGTPLPRAQAGDGVEDDTDVVPDASRISPPRLVPGFDPKTALKIGVEILNGFNERIHGLTCSQHAIQSGGDADCTRVTLALEDELLDRDFVLKWRLSGQTISTSCRTYVESKELCYGMLSIFPPRRDGYLGAPRDVIFVLDRSGSMQGIKMAWAARACSALLETLTPRDRFAIQAFDNVVEWYKPDHKNNVFLQADESGRERGHKHLHSIESRGGTELQNALKEALQEARQRTDAAGRIPVVVLLTDGEVGDESGCLKRIQTDAADCRLFTVGIDTAVNDGFLQRLAVLGGGTSSLVVPGTGLEDALRAISREIGTPLATDVTIEDIDAGMIADSMAPTKMPDLFAGRSSTVFFNHRQTGKIRVRGRYTDGAWFEEVIHTGETPLPAIAHLWARTRVSELEDKFRVDPSQQKSIRAEIIKLAVKHTLLTRFTAFIAVDESEVINPDGTRKKVVQPVHQPAKWESSDHDKIGLMESASVLVGGIFGGTSPMAQAPAPSPAPSFSRGKMRKASSGMLPSMPPAGRAAPPAKASNVPEQTEISKTEVVAIRKSVESLAKAIAETLTTLRSGQMPSAIAVDKARTELLKTLSGTSLALQLPLLQRYLRATLVELVGALNSADPGSLALFERHVKTFDDVQTEVTKVLNQASGSPGNFWEQNI